MPGGSTWWRANGEKERKAMRPVKEKVFWARELGKEKVISGPVVGPLLLWATGLETGLEMGLT